MANMGGRIRAVGDTVYHLSSSKPTRAAQDVLSGFEGTLMVDGYKVYPIVAELEGNIQIAHCWAHADRRFKDAKDPLSQVATVRGLIADSKMRKTHRARSPRSGA